MQPGEHRSSEQSAARVGLTRGVLVILTAVAIGAFVVSQGLDDNQLDAVAAAGGETSAGVETTDGADSTTVTTPTSSSTGVEQTTSTEVMVDDTTSTTDTTAPAGTVIREPADVKVLVLNAAGTKGIAGRASEILQDAGYEVLAPKNANTLGPTEVLYLDTFEAEARAVSEAFGLDPVSVAPYDAASPPINDIREAIVIVVIGEDGLIDV